MSQKPQRAAVRVGALEKTLEDFNAEMAVKVSEVLKRYDAEYVAPLRAEVERLGTPLWRRILARFRR